VCVCVCVCVFVVVVALAKEFEGGLWFAEEVKMILVLDIQFIKDRKRTKH
jgi:hypothetical protein